MQLSAGRTCLPVRENARVEAGECIVQDANTKLPEDILLAGKVIVVFVESPETVVEVKNLRGEPGSGARTAQ